MIRCVSLILTILRIVTFPCEGDLMYVCVLKGEATVYFCVFVDRRGHVVACINCGSCVVFVLFQFISVSFLLCCLYLYIFFKESYYIFRSYTLNVLYATTGLTFHFEKPRRVMCVITSDRKHQGLRGYRGSVSQVDIIRPWCGTVSCSLVQLPDTS